MYYIYSRSYLFYVCDAPSEENVGVGLSAKGRDYVCTKGFVVDI